MLRYLHIRNLSVIESLEISFQPGLNVITGETGAGKSIVIGAVGLLLGDRASSDLVRTGEETANIQAVFEADGRETIVRREITAQGRSRSFIDGQLVPAVRAKELGASLVDLHGQHEHQALLDPDTHLDLLDQYAGLAAEREAVSAAYAEWAALVSERDSVGARERDRESREEFLRFQLGEIDRTAPLEGEDEELAAERRVLANAEKVRLLCEEAYGALYERDASAIGTLASVWKRIEDLRAIDARFAPYLEAREGVDAQLTDLASFLREYGSRVESAPERLQDVEARLASLERLKRKYGPTLGDVLGRRRRCADELAALGSSAERLAELQALVAQAGKRYLSAAERLSSVRRRNAPKFSRALVGELSGLAMERTRFEVRFEDGGASESRWSPRGFDAGQFFVSPNPGEELRPLARVVSGGELSRVMLALKTIATTDSPGKTLVFDEVDAGIGGRVADVVGRRLRDLGKTFQVLCITHLPQIAACGDWHYRVTKSERRGRTQTTIEALTERARVDELARMMAGLVVTEGSRASAREMLLVRRGEGEDAAKGERRK
ncbi:MAG TPA: DNA repair protein RecN [Vicinamibacterales bacterium]|nr:DNA repair protein RecN [Vicinamibacterales bacterium]HPW21387.1 DNA repair protein RecN [Vicinamibacterales bacterium]